MKEYASLEPTQNDIKVILKAVSKKVIGATLHLTLSCVFLREGKATYVPVIYITVLIFVGFF